MRAAVSEIFEHSVHEYRRSLFTSERTGGADDPHSYRALFHASTRIAGLLYPTMLQEITFAVNAEIDNDLQRGSNYFAGLKTYRQQSRRDRGQPKSPVVRLSDGQKICLVLPEETGHGKSNLYAGCSSLRSPSASASRLTTQHATEAAAPKDRLECRKTSTVRCDMVAACH